MSSQIYAYKGTIQMRSIVDGVDLGQALGSPLLVSLSSASLL